MQRISGDLGGPCGEGPGSASLTLGDLEQGAREGAFRATALRISLSFVSLPFSFLPTVDTRERKGARWQVRPSSQNNSILIGRRRKARGWPRKLFTLYIKTRGEGTLPVHPVVASSDLQLKRGCWGWGSSREKSRGKWSTRKYSKISRPRNQPFFCSLSKQRRSCLVPGKQKTLLRLPST